MKLTKINEGFISKDQYKILKRAANIIEDIAGSFKDYSKFRKYDDLAIRITELLEEDND